jgi:hypothetical protein
MTYPLICDGSQSLVSKKCEVKKGIEHLIPVTDKQPVHIFAPFASRPIFTTPFLGQ